jgi:hypothetical protein
VPPLPPKTPHPLGEPISLRGFVRVEAVHWRIVQSTKKVFSDLLAISANLQVNLTFKMISFYPL